MKEPSMSLIKRMAEVAPDKLAGEILRLRTERDDLKKALTFKMSAHVATLKLEKTDVLLVRVFKEIDPALVAETVEALCDRLRATHGWEGAVLVQSGMSTVERMSKEEAEAMFEKLKTKLGK